MPSESLATLPSTMITSKRGRCCRMSPVGTPMGPVDLDSDGDFDGPGTGCFTVLSPDFLHGVVWCDRGAQVTLDTKGSMSAPMARTMLSHALVESRYPRS